MKHAVTITAVTAVLVAATSATAGATPPDGDIERADLGQGTTDVPVVIVSVGHPTTLYVQQLELNGPAASGWHTHPGPEHTVITEGIVYVQSAPDCVPIAYPAGRSVYIPAGVPHIVRNEGPGDADAVVTRAFVPHIVRNEGPGDADAVVTYTLPADRAVRDDAPAACP